MREPCLARQYMHHYLTTPGSLELEHVKLIQSFVAIQKIPSQGKEHFSEGTLPDSHFDQTIHYMNVVIDTFTKKKQKIYI